MLSNYLLMNGPNSNVIQNYSSNGTSFNNRRGLLSDKTNIPDVHANQQNLGTDM